MAQGKFSQPRGQQNNAPQKMQTPKSAPVNTNDPWEKELEEIKALSGISSPQKTSKIPAPVYQKPAYKPINQYDYPVDEKPEGFFSRHRTGLIVLVCVLAFVLIVGTSAMALITFLGGSSPDQNVILNNVTIAGINVGGMTQEQAKAAAEKGIGDKYRTTDMVVKINDAVVILSPAKTNVSVDISAAVDAALSYGHEGSKAEQASAKADSYRQNYAINLSDYLEVNTGYIRGVLEEQTRQFGDLFRQSSYSLEGTAPALDAGHFDDRVPCQTLVLNVGAAGYGIDTEELMEQILDAYANFVFQIDARTASTERTPNPLDLDRIYQEYYIAPVDGVSYGYGFDLQNAKQLVRTATANEEIRIPMEYIAPNAPIAAADFRDVLASCQTVHNHYENRNNNLTLLCQALNGRVLQPGEILSFNQAVGERSYERGYKNAPDVNQYSLAEPVGGGISQGAATLYYCALMADLEIQQRSYSEYKPSYIEDGLDAFVGWPGPDLVIRNNQDHAVKITAECTQDYLTFQILGTDNRDYYVKIESQMSTLAMDTIYQDVAENGSYQNGDIIHSGSTGFYVQTYRCRYSKATNTLLSREEEAGSNYPSRPQVIARVVHSTPETLPSTAPTDVTVPPETTQPATEPAPTSPPATEAPPQPETQPATPPVPETPTAPPAPEPIPTPSPDYAG